MTRQADGTYITDRQLFSRFSADRTGAFYAEESGVLWFGTGGLLARFDTTRFERSTPPFSALVRRVTVNQASLVSPRAAARPALSAESRSIRFEFAAPSFLNERSTQFLAQRIQAMKGNQIASASDLPTVFAAQGPVAKHRLEPPKWLGWAMVSIGSVLILHSLALKKPGG